MKAWTLLTLSGIFRAIQEQGKWRNSADWSILYNTWWLQTDHPWQLDGYHICSGLHVVCLFFAARCWKQPPKWLPVAWIYFYQINNLFYHYILTPAHNRDWIIFF